MTFIEYAQLAYAAYGKVTDFKNYQGLPMPKWEELPPKIQEAWVAAVREIVTLAITQPPHWIKPANSILAHEMVNASIFDLLPADESMKLRGFFEAQEALIRELRQRERTLISLCHRVDAGLQTLPESPEVAAMLTDLEAVRLWWYPV